MSLRIENVLLFVLVLLSSDYHSNQCYGEIKNYDFMLFENFIINEEIFKRERDLLSLLRDYRSMLGQRHDQLNQILRQRNEAVNQVNAINQGKMDDR